MKINIIFLLLCLVPVWDTRGSKNTRDIEKKVKRRDMRKQLLGFSMTPRRLGDLKGYENEIFAFIYLFRYGLCCGGNPETLV